MSITLEHDTITITKGKPTAYIIVKDSAGTQIGTMSIEFTDQADLQTKIEGKLAKFEEADSAVKSKEGEAKAAIEAVNAALAAKAQKEAL